MIGDHPSSNPIDSHYNPSGYEDHSANPVKVKFISRSLQQAPSDTRPNKGDYGYTMSTARPRSYDSTQGQSDDAAYFSSNPRSGSSDPRKRARPQRGGVGEINYAEGVLPELDTLLASEQEYQEPSNHLVENDSMDAEGEDTDADGHDEDIHTVELKAEADDQYMEEASIDEDEVVSVKPKRTTRRVVISEDDDEEEAVAAAKRVVTVTNRGRSTTRPVYYLDGSEEDEEKPSNGRKGLQRGGRKEEDFVDDDDLDEDDLDEDDTRGYGSRKKSSRAIELARKRKRQAAASDRDTRNGGRRSTASKKASSKRSNSYGLSTAGTTTDDDDLDLNDDDEGDDDLGVGKEYKLRDRGEPVNYFLPAANAFDIPQLERTKRGRGRPPKNFGSFLPASMSGAQYAELYPDKNRDADSVGPLAHLNIHYVIAYL